MAGNTSFGVGGFASGLSRGMRTGMEYKRFKREQDEYEKQKAQEEAYKEARRGLPGKQTLDQIPEVSGENFVGPLPAGQEEAPTWNPYDRLEAEKAKLEANPNISDEQREKLLAAIDKTAVSGASQLIYQGEMNRNKPERAVKLLNKAAGFLGPDVGEVFSVEDGKIMVGGEEFTPQMSATMAAAAKDPTAALAMAQEWLFKDRAITADERRAGAAEETAAAATTNAATGQERARLDRDALAENRRQFDQKFKQDAEQFDVTSAQKWLELLTDDQYKRAMTEIDRMKVDGTFDPAEVRKIEDAVNTYFEETLTGPTAVVGDDPESQALYQMLAGDTRVATMSKGLMTDMMTASGGQMGAADAAKNLFYIYQGFDDSSPYQTVVDTEKGIVSVVDRESNKPVVPPTRVRPGTASVLFNLGSLSLAPRRLPVER